MKFIVKIYKAVRKKYWFNKLRSIVDTKPKVDKGVRLYFSKNGNFGDELNNDLMRYLALPYIHSKPLTADATFIGSNLQKFTNVFPDKVSKKHLVHVLGAGFIEQSQADKEFFMFDMKIHAIRGELSKKRSEKILGYKLKNTTLGDPGLLINRMFPGVKRSSKYHVGVICHVMDKDSQLIKKINLKNKKTLFIDIEQKPVDFIKQVAQCEFILSSAMHGLICADSLGIPNKHIVLSDKLIGGEYKFNDYYSVFPNFHYNPIYLANTSITDKDIETYKDEYSITSNEIETICDNLQATFDRFTEDIRTSNV